LTTVVIRPGTPVARRNRLITTSRAWSSSYAACFAVTWLEFLRNHEGRLAGV
jgi:hypothetical protein